MIIHPDSHVDHDISLEQLENIHAQLGDRTGFFIETIELPEALGTVPNDLYGPSCGDAPVPESEVHYARRGPRQWDSRMCRRPRRQTRLVRVIAGPHDGHDCVLYTAYGVARKDSPQSPKEPGDLFKQRLELHEKIRATPTDAPERAALDQHNFDIDREIDESKAYWATHALAVAS